jgi:putative oxidoreductase
MDDNEKCGTGICGLLHSVYSKLSFLPPLLARIIIGFIFVQSGWGKFHHLDKVVEFFTQLGIPAPSIQAPFVAGVEFVCGFLVLVGLVTRFASIPLICTMIVAILTAKMEDIHGLGDLFATSEFLYIALLLWLAVAGAGCLSVDHFWCRRCCEKKPETN